MLRVISEKILFAPWTKFLLNWEKALARDEVCLETFLVMVLEAHKLNSWKVFVVERMFSWMFVAKEET